MANKTIPELTIAPSVAVTDLLPLDNGTQTFKATVLQLAEKFSDATDYRGVPIWNAAATYGVGAIVCDGAQTGFLYVSMATSNTNHALTVAGWWRKLVKPVVAAITGNVTLGTDHYDAVLPINTTSGAINVTLFTGGAARHTSFTIKDTHGTFQTNAVTIVRAGSESIEGVAANFVCNRKYGVWTFITDGTNWFIIAQNPQIDTTSKAQTIGSKAVSSNQLFIPNNGYVTSDTADAADNKTLILSGGGGGSAWSQNRGAGVVLNGNEVSGAEGEAVYYAGNSGSANGRHRWVAKGIDGGMCSKDAVWTLGPITLIGGTSFPGNKIVGKNDNSTIAAGYVGERIGLTFVGAIVGAGWTNVANFVLTPGRWILAGIVAGSGTATDVINQGWSTANSGAPTLLAAAAPLGLLIEMAMPCQIIDVTTTTTYYVMAYRSTGANASWGSSGVASAVRMH
jgi:hypothetical protein